MLTNLVWVKESLRRPDHTLSPTLSLIRDADLETTVLLSLSRFSMSSQSRAAGDMQECLRVSGEPYTESQASECSLWCFLKTRGTWFAVKSDTKAEISRETFLVRGLKVQF